MYPPISNSGIERTTNGAKNAKRWKFLESTLPIWNKEKIAENPFINALPVF
jgi:hypothetical protein